MSSFYKTGGNKYSEDFGIKFSLYFVVYGMDRCKKTFCAYILQLKKSKKYDIINT